MYEHSAMKLWPRSKSAVSPSQVWYLFCSSTTP